MSVEQFLSMGGYAFYVWTSYAVVLVVLIVNLLLPLKRRKAVEKGIVRLLRQSGSRS